MFDCWFVSESGMKERKRARTHKPVPFCVLCVGRITYLYTHILFAICWGAGCSCSLLCGSIPHSNTHIRYTIGPVSHKCMWLVYFWRYNVKSMLHVVAYSENCLHWKCVFSVFSFCVLMFIHCKYMREHFYTIAYIDGQQVEIGKRERERMSAPNHCEIVPSSRNLNIDKMLSWANKS